MKTLQKAIKHYQMYGFIPQDMQGMFVEVAKRAGDEEGIEKIFRQNLSRQDSDKLEYIRLATALKRYLTKGEPL